MYNLPRRELQALCKQYGIPANKTNVAMADALSACVPADTGKSKASAGMTSLGVSKTTPMKHKLEKKTGLPETSLASLILNGKKKISPLKTADKLVPVGTDEASFPLPNTTPLKRVKRSDRSLQVVPEDKEKVTIVPALTRAAAFLDKIPKAAPAPLYEKYGNSTTALSSPSTRALTPRKRPAEASATVTRRGGDALPPVSFSDLLATPKASKPQVPEVIVLNSTGKTAQKMKSRLGPMKSPPEEETTCPAPTEAGVVKKVSRGKRVAFADEVVPKKSATKEPEPQPEPETETLELPSAEIEFKNSALHKELFGLPNSITKEEQLVNSPAPTEERCEDIPAGPRETGFEFRDMALHKELLGSHPNLESNSQGSTLPLHDPGQSGASPTATEWASSACGSLTPSLTPPAAGLNNATPAQGGSIRPSEDACGRSTTSVEVLEPPHRELPGSRHLGSLVDALSPDKLAESQCVQTVEASDHSHADTTAFRHRMEDDTNLAVAQSTVAPTAVVHAVTDQERDVEDGLRGNSEILEVCTLLNGRMDISCETSTVEEGCVSSTPELDKAQKILTGSTPTSDELPGFHRGSAQKGEATVSLPTASAKAVAVAGAELPTSVCRLSVQIPVTPVRTVNSNSASSLAEAVTPLTKIQSNIDCTLAKATSILEKLAAWRADAEKKVREGYWEPKFSSVVDGSPPTAVFKTPVTKTVPDRDLRSAKKAKLIPKATIGSENGFVICEDANIVCEGEVPSAQKMRSSDELTSNKENQSDVASKVGGQGKEKKKGKKFEVLKDRSTNSSDESAHATGRVGTGPVRPEDMSLRKLRATVKERVRQMESFKTCVTRAQKG